ncbi:DUF6794 domain-containing protein [Duganella sp. Root1480D1]|uniref:DUF6794 domain-containing protein n=1 Tax=Duganella sp. Root1480D1 TaxID=1736471 RepID=UPI0012E3DFEA|nr:DUF6794 domain-containing protein [Duganella sp. Root1480D1]
MKRQTDRLITAVCLSILAVIAVGAAVSGRFGPNEYPDSVDAAADMLIARLSEEDRLRVKNTKKDDLVEYHHGWGTSIRNDFGLWAGNEKLLRSACHGEICHPDDASMVIIETVWTRLQK